MQKHFYICSSEIKYFQESCASEGNDGRIRFGQNSSGNEVRMTMNDNNVMNDNNDDDNDVMIMIMQ